MCPLPFRVTLTIGGHGPSLKNWFLKSASPWSVNATAFQKMLRKILFAPDPPIEGGPAPEPSPAPAPAPAPAGAPPPAAAAVIDGKTERELQLEKQLEEENGKRKKAETDASYLADENRRLKETPAPPKKSSGWYFPDEE